MLFNIQSSSDLVETSTMLGIIAVGLPMYAVEIIKLLVINSLLLFVLRDIMNHFGLGITIHRLKVVDLKVVEILGRITQFLCWMLTMK